MIFGCLFEDEHGTSKRVLQTSLTLDQRTDPAQHLFRELTSVPSRDTGCTNLEMLITQEDDIPGRELLL